jgi:hypothetical protein
MDKRLNKKSELYVTQFKDDLRTKITGLCFDEKSKVNELIEYVYEYERLNFVKDDFVKRKRVKNSIPDLNRCNAKRANGEQCTRRRKEQCEFCGTHFKGAPHGLITSGANPTDTHKHNLEVLAEDVNGIIYYVDKHTNVYNMEDILGQKENPRIIGNYNKSIGFTPLVSLRA